MVVARAAITINFDNLAGREQKISKERAAEATGSHSPGAAQQQYTAPASSNFLVDSATHAFSALVLRAADARTIHFVRNRQVDFEGCHYSMIGPEEFYYYKYIGFVFIYVRLVDVLCFKSSRET